MALSRVWIVACAALVLAAAPARELAVGERAPEFALRGSDGAEHKLSGLLRRGGVVLAFFPKAFTPG